MKMQQSVLFVTSEAAPFAKSGGLADVLGSLPVAMKQLQPQCHWQVIMPLFAEIAASIQERMVKIAEYDVQLGWRKLQAQLYCLEENGVLWYFVGNVDYFGRPSMYGYDDDSERYLFFSKAVVSGLHLLHVEPDIVHCHDWHTGMIPFWLKQFEMKQQRWTRKPVQTIFTIHNLQYQGNMEAALWQDIAELEDCWLEEDYLDQYGNGNPMLMGVMFADQVTTVSEQYAQEIVTAEYGEGLHAVLLERYRRGELTGICNGIDLDSYNPETDCEIAVQYGFGKADLLQKEQNKRIMQLSYGWEQAADIPLIAMVTRLTNQKGLDLVIELLPELLAQSEHELEVFNRVQWVIQGTGDAKYERILGQLSKQYGNRFAMIPAFDENRARRVYAAADYFLMPSRFEPCGLAQMIAMRYRAVPITRATGGLKDTVHDMDADPERGTGYVFALYRKEALKQALLRALTQYKKQPVWQKLHTNIASTFWGWERTAGSYRSLYETLFNRNNRKS